MFYADDLCIMTPCAIALQELLNICYCYSITVDLNFKVILFCIYSKIVQIIFAIFAHNRFTLSYADFVKYLGFTFVSTHKDDDDMLSQM